ncbi:MAG: hypothetical protein ABW116_01585 [Candidatus Sedimenticola sp. 20ELBAFRAG]
MDFIAEQYRKMQISEATTINKAADAFMEALFQHAENNKLSEKDVNQINKFLRKILNGSFKNQREKDIALAIFDKVKEL